MNFVCFEFVKTSWHGLIKIGKIRTEILRVFLTYPETAFPRERSSEQSVAMTGSILGWCHTNDGCAQTQRYSSKRLNQTLLKPEILARKENWNRAFLRFGCALRGRSGCCRISTDSISKLTQMIRDSKGRQKDH